LAQQGSNSAAAAAQGAKTSSSARSLTTVPWQAIYLDIVLIFPQLLGSINGAITGG
jgi:hypothetical protein